MAVVAALTLGGCGRKNRPIYDLVLHGGVVVDGTGAPRRAADVAVVRGRIALIAESIPAHTGKRALDIANLVIAPGFFDNHAHLVDLEDHPQAENFLRQGVTTILGSLHSQEQVHPIGPYKERLRMAPNVGLFAGHTWIRQQVLGLADRAPTPPELEAMQDLVEAAMEDGALGLSTGLGYVPAIYADTDELVALARVAARYGGIYVTHLRDEGARVLESIEESLEIGRRAAIPVQINHLKVTGAAHFGTSERILAVLDNALAEGLEVAHDIYPYTAYSTYSDLMFPGWSLADGAEALARRVAEPRTRQRLVEEMRVRFQQQTGSGPESIQFRELPAEGGLAEELEGRTLAEYLDARGRARTVEEAVEALIELQLAGGFIGIFFGMDERDVRRFLQHPRTMIETDGDLVEPGVGHPHPRSYGSFPRVLAKYVRDEGVLTLEEAIRRMTSRPADWFGQRERGRLEAGKIADLVVFDADRIHDRSEYTDPHHFSDGVVHLLVHGTPVLENAELTGAIPGRFLERLRDPTEIND